jgi:hypothetical protein
VSLCVFPHSFFDRAIEPILVTTPQLGHINSLKLLLLEMAPAITVKMDVGRVVVGSVITL